jgi:hypothetical protein
MTCIWFELLCRVVPFAGLRLRLCRQHVEHCLRCQQESNNSEALPPLLVTAGQLPPDLDLWSGVRAGIAGRGYRLPQKKRPWLWASAAAMAVLLVASIWIVFYGRHSEPQPKPIAHPVPVQTRMCSASIENRPARVFLIQSRNPDRTIFWIARDNKRS